MTKKKPTILLLYSQMIPSQFDPNILFAGGAQKRVYQMAQYFNKNGYEVILGSDDVEESRIIKSLKKEGVDHYKIPFRAGLYAQAGGFAKLFNLISKRKIDLIHSNDRWTSSFGYLISLLKRIPHIYTARNVFTDKKLTGLYFGKNIVAISEGVKKNLRDFFGIKPERIKVIYNGTEIEHADFRSIEKLKLEFDLVPENRIISVIGRLTEQKGLNFLLESLPRLIKQFPMVKILLVGDGELKDELKKMSAQLNVEKHVLFCGNREDVQCFIDICEFTVIPSLWEGLGVSAIESAMLGKPVIASKVGGLPEVVEDGINGILVEPKNSRALSMAMEELLLNPAKRKKMGCEAEKAATEKFSLGKMHLEYNNLYKSLLR